jgi:hypothetical protein
VENKDKKISLAKPISKYQKKPAIFFLAYKDDEEFN